MSHRRTLPAVVATVAALILAGCTVPAASTSTPSPDPSPGAAPEEVFTPVLGSVLAVPEAYPATDGLVHIAYELVLSNVLSQDVTLDLVRVTDGEDTLLELGGDALAPWVRIYGGDAGSLVMGPGQRALVWLDVTVGSMDEVPETIAHEVQISPETAIEPVVTSPMTELIAQTAVSSTEPIVISPPLRGEGWFDGNSCCGVTPHRAAINPINGALHAPERYAIDYAQLNADGRLFDGPRDELESYAYYGADIHAVADGPIVAMVWDLPEQTPGANPSGLSVAEYGGNHIVQDIGGGHYAFYAHLQPDNPLGVEIGQELEAGEVIARLGNTGNTDEPHLHFHVMDSPLPLASNGRPFVFDSFELEGIVPDDAIDACASEPEPCDVETAEAGAREAVGPLSGDVMTYH
ncbi:M23 family metallopeptidase [Microbacterium kunmingense]|uniref:M23 family metallopeptidase n=1 Tax=Microbacterium kunmingense TaxID=2915939 RepID=UPI003D70B977